jgi:hypothetical protein
VNCESVPGKTGSLSVSSYSFHSMMAIHYVPLDPPKNGGNKEASELDANFEFFELRAPAPGRTSGGAK